MSINAPYATLHDLPKYEKRAGVVGAPWFKDQETVKCSRGHDPIPYITCNSRTAPFATFHNMPETTELITAPPSESPIDQITAPPSESSVEQITAPPCESPLEQTLTVELRPLPTDSSPSPPEDLHIDSSEDHEDPVTQDLQPNLSTVHQAPWDRDDVHYKVVVTQFLLF